MKKATKKEALELIHKKREKYESLVWYARTSPKNYSIRGVKKNIRIIEGRYKKECEDLNNPDINDWTHGFNSGMLAGLRYASSLMEINIEFAEEYFPELDT